MSQDMTVAEDEQIFLGFVVFFPKSLPEGAAAAKRSENMRRSITVSGQSGLPEPFTSSALHLHKWQQLWPFESIKMNAGNGLMRRSLLAAYWPNYTLTANTSLLHSELLCCIKGKKERCYRCSTLQFYQYLCCKEWHLQLFHNYLAGFPAIHLPNCCYDRWHTSSTITRVTVKHIYFSTQHLPSVFSESLNGLLILFSFLQLLSHSEKQFFFLFTENMSHKTHFLKRHIRQRDKWKEENKPFHFTACINHFPKKFTVKCEMHVKIDRVHLQEELRYKQDSLH